MCSQLHKVFELPRYMAFFSITSHFIVFADAQAFGGTRVEVQGGEECLHQVAGQHAFFSDQTPLYCVSLTHRRLEARVDKLKEEQNACVSSWLLGLHVVFLN